MTADRIPIVFVHGSGNNRSVWDAQVEYLAGKFRPYAIDLPGHGDAPGEPQPSIDYYADALERFVAEHGIERPVIAGHSLGGGVVLTAALRNPGEYRGLALIGTGARLRVLPALLELLATDFPRGLDLLEENKWATTTDPGLTAVHRRRAESEGGKTHWCDLTACDHFDAIGRLGSLTMPAIAIVGTEDRLTPVKYAQYLKDNLPNCRLTVVPAAGHMVQIEQPAVVNRAIEQFLTELS